MPKSDNIRKFHLHTFGNKITIMCMKKNSDTRVIPAELNLNCHWCHVTLQWKKWSTKHIKTQVNNSMQAKNKSTFYARQHIFWAMKWQVLNHNNMWCVLMKWVVKTPYKNIAVIFIPKYTLISFLSIDNAYFSSIYYYFVHFVTFLERLCNISCIIFLTEPINHACLNRILQGLPQCMADKFGTRGKSQMPSFEIC